MTGHLAVADIGAAVVPVQRKPAPKQVDIWNSRTVVARARSAVSGVSSRVLQDTPRAQAGCRMANDARVDPGRHGTRGGTCISGGSIYALHPEILAIRSRLVAWA